MNEWIDEWMKRKKKQCSVKILVRWWGIIYTDRKTERLVGKWIESD